MAILNSVNQNVGTFKVSDGTAFTTMTVNLVSGVLDVSDMVAGGTLIVRWTGTPVGTFSVNGSGDGVTYDVPLLANQAAGGATGMFALELNTGLKSIEVNYAFGSSTGVWTTVFVTKKVLS